MPSRPNNKAARRVKIATSHPDWTPSQVDDEVRRSYSSSNPEKLKRQRQALVPGGHAKVRRQREVEGTAAPNVIGRTPVEGMGILEFAEVAGIELYAGQRVILKSLYGMRLDEGDLPLYAQMTGGLAEQHEPGREAVEGLWCLGARSGKSTMCALVALYEAIARAPHWRKFLRRNEEGYAVVVATRLQQAQDVIGANAARMLADSQRLAPYLKTATQTKLELTTGLSILSLPCNSTAGRGLPIVFLAFDEIAHFFVEGVKADAAIYNSLSPRLAQFPGAKTLMLSTPSAKQGVFFQSFSEGFQVPGRQTIQAPTVLVNPKVDASYLERMRRRDEENYRREFDAQFADQVSAFFASDTVDSAMTIFDDVPPSEGARYVIGVDQSGLSGRDRFGLAIAHAEPSGTVIVDIVRSWDSRDPDSILTEIAALAKAYRATEVLIDQYGAGWVSSALQKIGLEPTRRPTLPAVYVNVRSLLVAGRLRLQSSAELRNGLISTQSYFGRNNSMSIAHERTADGHADMADAVAAACWGASGGTEERAFDERDIMRAMMGGRTCRIG